MSWTAVVSLKSAADRKSRLAGRLTSAARLRLSEQMAAHVVDCLARCPALERIYLLSPVPNDLADWWHDTGRGLNAELDALRCEIAAPMLVVHADLPLLGADDIAALIAAADGHKVAIAPDRHGTGTNALALSGSDCFNFAFGTDSFARHSQAAESASIIRRRGLLHDVDTPDDLDTAFAAGFRFSIY